MQAGGSSPAGGWLGEPTAAGWAAAAASEDVSDGRAGCQRPGRRRLSRQARTGDPGQRRGVRRAGRRDAGDLIDLPLLRDLLAPEDMPAVRVACVELFSLRDKQTWPPQVTTYPSWADGFAAMAAEIGFPTTDIEAAAQQLRDFIAEIDAAL
jgi:hypothetical protein